MILSFIIAIHSVLCFSNYICNFFFVNSYPEEVIYLIKHTCSPKYFFICFYVSNFWSECVWIISFDCSLIDGTLYSYYWARTSVPECYFAVRTTNAFGEVSMTLVFKDILLIYCCSKENIDFCFSTSSGSLLQLQMVSPYLRFFLEWIKRANTNSRYLS